MSATELKTRTGEFLDILLSDGEVTLTRNGRRFEVCLREPEGTQQPKRLGECLAMSEEDLAGCPDWDVPSRPSRDARQSVSFD